MKKNINLIICGGQALALGISWHLDSGFFNILVDTILGWVYVAYKISQFVWPV